MQNSLIFLAVVLNQKILAIRASPQTRTKARGGILLAGNMNEDNRRPSLHITLRHLIHNALRQQIISPPLQIAEDNRKYPLHTTLKQQIYNAFSQSDKDKRPPLQIAPKRQIIPLLTSTPLSNGWN